MKIKQEASTVAAVYDRRAFPAAKNCGICERLAI
jgi:hypothetical protein